VHFFAYLIEKEYCASPTTGGCIHRVSIVVPGTIFAIFANQTANKAPNFKIDFLPHRVKWFVRLVSYWST
jgi:hypothetical protein